MYPQGDAALGIDSTAGEIDILDPLLQFTDSMWLLSSSSPAINASINSYPFISEDIQGQIREDAADVGSDEYSTSPVRRRPLTKQDVGPDSNIIISTIYPVGKKPD